MSKPTDYLGDVQGALARLEGISPKRAEVRITNSDSNPNRYGVTLWNIFGKWYASEVTLAASIHRVIDIAEAEDFRIGRER